MKTFILERTKAMCGVLHFLCRTDILLPLPLPLPVLGGFGTGFGVARALATIYLHYFLLFLSLET